MVISILTCKSRVIMFPLSPAEFTTIWHQQHGDPSIIRHFHPLGAAGTFILCSRRRRRHAETRNTYICERQGDQCFSISFHWRNIVHHTHTLTHNIITKRKWRRWSRLSVLCSDKIKIKYYIRDQNIFQIIYLFIIVFFYLVSISQYVQRCSKRTVSN